MATASYHRPRHPSPETVAYLKSLPLDLHVSTDEVARFLSCCQTTTTTTTTTTKNHASGHDDLKETENLQETVEFPQTLAAAISAIDEIRHEIASLAGDEKAAEMIELLAHIAAPYSEVVARTLLHAVSGYCLHLATHRYGSHVLQTLLQLAVTSWSESDLALHKDAPPLSENDHLPSLVDLLVGIQEELLTNIFELAFHICGSHVLRTLLCVLGGVKMLFECNNPSDITSGLMRRGKSKKKKKKKKADEGVSAGSATLDIIYESCSRISTHDERIERAILQITSALSGSQTCPPGELQQMACHNSSGPLLIVLLRVLTYRESRDEWQERLQQWEEVVARGAEHHLAKLRPEPTFAIGSEAHNLAQRLLCWKDDQEEQPWAGDVIYGLAGEARASHVLEVLLRSSPNQFYASILRVGDFVSSTALQEYAEHEVSNFVVQIVLATIRDREQAEQILLALKPTMTSGLVIDASRKRRGILWRAVEAAARYNVMQKEILQAVKEGFLAVEGVESVKRFADCVPLLLNMRKPEKDGDRLVLDVPGTRALHYMLRFHPEACKDVLNGILNLSIDELELLAKDGLGSVCIWDGIVVEGPVKDPIFAEALSKLVSKLSGRWVALSCDRVGHHVVIKVFRASDMGYRRQLVGELSRSMSRLNGSTIGRSVSEACAVRAFLSTEGTKWLEDLEPLTQNSKKRKRHDHRGQKRRTNLETA